MDQNFPSSASSPLAYNLADVQYGPEDYPGYVYHDGSMAWLHALANERTTILAQIGVGAVSFESRLKGFSRPMDETDESAD